MALASPPRDAGIHFYYFLMREFGDGIPLPLPRHKTGKEGTGQKDSWRRIGSAKSGKLKNLRPGGRPGTRDRPGNGHFLSDGTIPAHGQPPYVDVLVKV